MIKSRGKFFETRKKIETRTIKHDEEQKKGDSEG